MQALYAFRDNIMPHYSKLVEAAINALSKNGGNIDENEFIDACRWVYDGVREIRRAVLVNRAYEDIESDSDIEEEDEEPEPRSRTTSVAESSGQYML